MELYVNEVGEFEWMLPVRATELVIRIMIRSTVTKLKLSDPKLEAALNLNKTQYALYQWKHPIAYQHF